MMRKARPVKCQVWVADNVDLPLAERKCLCCGDGPEAHVK